MSMRSLLTTLCLMALISSCQENPGKAGSTATGPTQTGLVSAAADTANFTTIQWKESTIDFGKITEGQKLEVVYHFTNTGDKPLVINRVTPGCGCTVAETPTEPIAPGKEGVIKGSFDSNGRVGTQHKSIFVYANTKGTQNHELVFTVEVNKKG